MPDDAGHDEDPSREAPTSARSQRRHARSARLLAFKVLYEVDIARHSPAEVFKRQAEEARPSPEAEVRASTLVRGVLAHRADIDSQIQSHATAWPLDQISAVERNILRIALYEVRFDEPHVPAAVAINEAVELAKMFGSDAASRFVNGVLGAIASDLEVGSPDQPERPEQSDPQGGTD